MKAAKGRMPVLIVVLLAVLTCAPLTCFGAAEGITFGGKKYSLAFFDEFDSFDQSKWAYCPEQKRQNAGGVWRNSCSTVKNGNFVITCDVARDGTPISGGIRSTGEYEQTFGLYHIRFKAEKADGLWYAFWLLTDRMDDFSVGNGATDGAELDMIELVPHIGQYGMSVHWDGYGEALKSKFDYTDVTDAFYGIYHELWYVWDSEGYRLYMDGTDESHLVFDFPGDEYGDGTCAVPCDLIISAEFGSWGGEIDRSQLPAHLYVDYVRVYKEVYGVTYDYDGGTLPEGLSNPAGYDGRSSVALNAPVKAGAVFGGWYDNPELRGEPVSAIPKGSAGERAFYAKWLAPSLADGKITAPGGALLILAEYDAGGRLAALQCKTLEADIVCTAPEALGFTVPKAAFRLLLVNKANYAPLCAAWQG